MDVTDIGKVASRKRMNADAEKLRDKVSRETAKIIKLKVAQDTAYWDLKERLQQLQGAHERLQQNMVDVQMQHEAASAGHARELRLRPDTLNKVAGARGVCAALEQWGARLRGTVARCRADRAALQAAYEQCGARVRTLHAELARARRLHHAQRAAARSLGGRARLADAALAGARAELARLLRRLDAQADDMRHEAGEARAAAERERRGAAAARDELRRARDLLANSENTIDLMKQKEAMHIEKIENLEKVINDKSQHEQELETEIKVIQQSVRQLEAEKLRAREQLDESERACAALRDQLAERTADLEQRSAQLSDAQREQHDQRDAAALAAAAAARALDAHTATIARLMADLRAESDARARADAALGAARRAHDDELAKQMSVIREVRADKERLQERIQGMQNTIDNIQKELTGRLAAPKACDVADAPEPGPRPTELYSFLSDGSVDGDALDPREVGRRFRALASGGGGGGGGGGRLRAAQVRNFVLTNA